MPDVSFLFDSQFIPFTIAILVMFGIGVMEVVGLGVSAIDLHIPDFHADADTDGDLDFLGFLGIGKVPLMVTLVSALTLFGLSGIIIQNTLLGLIGHALPLFLAIPAAVFITLVMLGVTSKIIAKIMPTDETTAVSLNSLIWRKGIIPLGNATRGNPTRAKVEDEYGTDHFIMVEPESDSFTLREGDVVRILRREGDLFYAESLESPFQAT